MRKKSKQIGIRKGFSLAEVVVTLIISSMVLIAILTIYNRFQRSADIIISRLYEPRVPLEVLQRIADDLDKAISADSGTSVTFENKTQDDYHAAKLTIKRTYTDDTDRERNYEEITWVSSYDLESSADGLVLYRSYNGIALEDKILDKNKEDWEKKLFVPICKGVTYFKIDISGSEEETTKYSGALPGGIVVTISFARPYIKSDGSVDVPEESKLTRVIALDRTREINFSVIRG